MHGSSNIISGTEHAQSISKILQKITQILFDNYHIKPVLAIVIIGSNPASITYVNNKIKVAATVGVDTIKIHFNSDITELELLNTINKLNDDIKISGIIVQLPLPAHINKDIVINTISPLKDVDGFHPLNVGYLCSNTFPKTHPVFIPCTALGCLSLIKKYTHILDGKKVAIISRSNIVGKPLSSLLIQQNCTVTICHSKTKNLSTVTSQADIVVSGIGKPHFLTTEYFKNASIIIDVGITKNENGKISGDVDFDQVQKIAQYITPVPGGVGPMTIVFLLFNTIKACLWQQNLLSLLQELESQII